PGRGQRQPAAHPGRPAARHPPGPGRSRLTLLPVRAFRRPHAASLSARYLRTHLTQSLAVPFIRSVQAMPDPSANNPRQHRGGTVPPATSSLAKLGLWLVLALAVCLLVGIAVSRSLRSASRPSPLVALERAHPAP